MRSSSSSSSQTVVLLNVYDLWDNNESLYPFGLGLFHSGVQIGDREYTFAAGAGIFNHEPRRAPGAKFRETIKLGVLDGSTSRIDSIISELRPDFQGSDYNVILKNCNCFSEAFALRLLNKRIPGFVNRLANIGEFFSCLLPASVLSNTTRDPASVPLVSRDRQQKGNSSSSMPTVAFAGKGRKLSDI